MRKKKKTTLVYEHQRSYFKTKREFCHSNRHFMFEQTAMALLHDDLFTKEQEFNGS